MAQYSLPLSVQDWKDASGEDGHGVGGQAAAVTKLSTESQVSLIKHSFQMFCHYRVTHHIGPNLSLTSKQKLRFSIKSLYWNATFVLGQNVTASRGILAKMSARVPSKTVWGLKTRVASTIASLAFDQLSVRECTVISRDECNREWTLVG